VIVRRAYEDVLNREPDKDGLRTYRSRIIDDKWSEQDVRSDLRKSAERAGRTPAAADVIIRRAYQDVLGRDPDASGLATYRSKLINENWSERDVRSALKSSSERRETGGISNEQAQEMVRRAYQSVLGRDPDSSGSSLYVQKIRQNRWSEADVAKELRNSPEYRNKRKK
jgi:TorA maturation chaperone TorD